MSLITIRYTTFPTDALGRTAHGLNLGEAGLIFLALLGGGVISVLIYIFYFNPDYKRIHHSLNGKAVPPEVRLKALAYAAPVFAASFFIVGWTSYARLSIAGPIIGILLLGATVLFIFLSCFNVSSLVLSCLISLRHSSLSLQPAFPSLHLQPCCYIC